MLIDEVIGKRLAYLRNRLELSGEAFAKRLNDEAGTNWNRQTVSEVENGKRTVRVAELLALAALAKVPVTFFLHPPRFTKEVGVLGRSMLVTEVFDLFRPIDQRRSKSKEIDTVRRLLSDIRQAAHNADEYLKFIREPEGSGT